MRTRIFTLLVAFLAIAGNAVWAAEPEKPEGLTGEGTEISPYELDSKEDLKWFRDYVNEGNPGACAILTDNIDLNPGFTFNEKGYTGSGTPEEWKPIMYYEESTFSMSASYTGVFNGNGKTISGLYIDKNSALEDEMTGLSAYKGLFGVVGIADLITNNPIEENNAVVKELTVTGLIKGYKGDAAIGGIACMNAGTIQDCINNVLLVADEMTTGCGGICGANYGTIIGCINMANITIGSTNTKGYAEVGGICSLNSGSIEKCYNKGSITGTGIASVGGICGYLSNLRYAASIKNCYNEGSLTSENKVSGIGAIRAQSNSKNPISLTNCHNYGALSTEDGTDISRICEVSVGNGVPLTVQNNYYLENNAITETVEGAEAKNETAFDNGEVLWYLQHGAEGNEEVWTQGEYFPVFVSEENPQLDAYRVTFDYNYEGSEPEYQFALENSNTTVNFPADPTREGYNFLGWSESEEGEVISTENVPITQDITYYAQWQKIETEEPEQPGDDDEEDQDTDKPGTIVKPIKYYNIYIDTICPGLEVEVSKDVVQEGHQVSAYLTIQAECDTTGMRFEYKRGLFGYWKDLKELEGVQPGEYIIKNIYTDIYIRALDATLPEEEPTGIENLEGVKAYAKEGSIYVYTPNREEVTIISMSGAIIKNAEQIGLQSYSISRGIYIVRIGEKVFKLKN